MTPRSILCARITALRDALDILGAQAAVDGQGAFGCLGAVKVELITLEGRLRMLDGTLTEPAQRVNAAIQLDRYLEDWKRQAFPEAPHE